MVIWVMGLSGAGKTTIGHALYNRIKQSYPNTVFLDGDIFRNIMGGDLGFTVEERKKNAQRQANLCRMLDAQGIHVISCLLSNQPEIRKQNRETIENYFEIHLDVSLKTLKERDPKGLYKRVREGKTKNVVGIDIEYFPPENPDIKIDNNVFVDLDETVTQVLSQMPHVMDQMISEV